MNQALNRLNQTLGQLRGTASAPSRTATSTGGAIPVPFGGGQPAVAAQRVFNDSLKAYDTLVKAMRGLSPLAAVRKIQKYGIVPVRAPYELFFGTSQRQVRAARSLISEGFPDINLHALDFHRLLASRWIKS